MQVPLAVIVSQYVAGLSLQGRSLEVMQQNLEGGRGRPVCSWVTNTSVELPSSTRTG